MHMRESGDLELRVRRQCGTKKEGEVEKESERGREGARKLVINCIMLCENEGSLQHAATPTKPTKCVQINKNI